MPIKSVNQCLDARFIDVPDVRCCLTRFLATHDGMRVYQAEGVDYDFAFNGLDWVNDHRNRARGQLLKRLNEIYVSHKACFFSG